MPKRRPSSLGGLPAPRSVERWARTALKAGRRAVDLALATTAPAPRPRRKKAAKPAPTARATDARGWTLGVAAFGAVARRYRLYRPPGLVRATPAPLVVMLHGCGQDAAGFAAATRMNRVADREGFLVLYPEQDRLAHPNACWHWYDTRLGRAQAEAGAIVAAIDQVVVGQAADPARVAIAGLSAGAGMAALVASLAPARFAAVAMHSGIAPGVARSTATALAAMQGQRRAAVATAADPDAACPPPLLVIHGSADSVVRPVAGQDAATGWAAAAGATAMPPRTVRRGARRPMRVTDFRRAGPVWVSLCEVDGLGHAWSGGAAGQSHTDPAGPDASRLVWTFASQAFERAAADGRAVATQAARA